VCIVLGCATVTSSCTRVSTSSHLAGGNAATIHGVVRYAISNDLNTLNPVIGGLAYENAIEEAIFSGLVKLDDQERIIPDLAVEVPSVENGGVSADGRTITYHLRHGVRWQDGMPLTSADVAFTFARIEDPKVNAPNSAPYTHVAYIATPDPYTIVVHLKAPWAPAIGQLFCDGENGSIIPAHSFARSADFNRDPFGVHPIGSGAMELKAWERGARLVLVPNPTYFAGAPKIKELDILVVPDANTRLTLVTSKELDVAGIGSPNQVTRLRQLLGYSVRLVQFTWGNYLVFNLSRPLLADQQTREALALALDRPRLVETAYAGTAVSGSSFIPPYNWAYAADNRSPIYDLRGSRDLLARAGWRAGSDGVLVRGSQRLAFTVTFTTGNTIALSEAEQMQAQWRAIGADVALQVLPLNVLRSPDGLWTTGRFDVGLVNLVFDVDPDREANLGSGFIGSRGFNDGRYVSALSDRLSAQAVAVYPHAERALVYAKLQRLWNHDLPVLPIAWPQAIYVVNDDLRNFKPEPVNSDFWNIQEWEI
jgi:peptide/nickel transport system substrate-binding protein